MESRSSAPIDNDDECQQWDLNLCLSTPSPSSAFPHIVLPQCLRGLEGIGQAEKVPQTYLHGACLLIGASLGCHLKAVCHPPLRGPVSGCQLLHEVLQADNAMVSLEGLQLEVLLVGHMELQEKVQKERHLLSILLTLLKTFFKSIHSKTQRAQAISQWKSFWKRTPKLEEKKSLGEMICKLTKQ